MLFPTSSSLTPIAALSASTTSAPVIPVTSISIAADILLNASVTVFAVIPAFSARTINIFLLSLNISAIAALVASCILSVSRLISVQSLALLNHPPLLWN